MSAPSEIKIILEGIISDPSKPATWKTTFVSLGRAIDFDFLTENERDAYKNYESEKTLLGNLICMGIQAICADRQRLKENETSESIEKLINETKDHSNGT